MKSSRGAEAGAWERTARLAVSAAAKTYLQYMGRMRQEATAAEFAGCWLAVLQHMEQCARAAKTEVRGAPGRVKFLFESSRACG